LPSALGLATISQDPLLSVIEFLKGKQMLITLEQTASMSSKQPPLSRRSCLDGIGSQCDRH